MDQDIKKRFDAIDEQLRQILLQVESLEDSGLVADQATGTGAKLDEILAILRERQ